MMIYTSYFDNLRNLPENVVPISICGKAPDWYDGLQYRKLAPRLKFFLEWKDNHDNDFYIEHFNREVLSRFTQKQVVEELEEKLEQKKIFGKEICLICYERPGDFCHRHLVAAWLKDAGHDVEEL